jgi:hypothetical protein
MLLPIYRLGDDFEALLHRPVARRVACSAASA